MSDTLIQRAARALNKGSRTPFTDVARSYSDGELCALQMDTKNFLSDCLHDEALAWHHRTFPTIFGVIGLCVVATILLLVGYTMSAMTVVGIGHFVMWRCKKAWSVNHSYEQMKRVVDWMKYENAMMKETIDAAKRIMEG